MKKSYKYLIIVGFILITFFSVSAQDTLMYFPKSMKAEEIIKILKEKELFPANEGEISVVGGIIAPRILQTKISKEEFSIVTLRYAIALTGGLRRNSDTVIRLLRKDEKGIYSFELFVDIQKIKKGEIKDIWLKSNDIAVVVGDPKEKVSPYKASPPKVFY